MPGSNEFVLIPKITVVENRKENSVEVCLVQALKPVREQVAKRERVWQQKAADELDVSAASKEAGTGYLSVKHRAVSRALKIHDYSDTGRQWNALLEGHAQDDRGFQPTAEGRTISDAGQDAGGCRTPSR